MNYLINLRTKLREIRKKAGMTQQQFADMFSISYGYLSEIENGKKSLPIELLVGVLEKFELSPNEIFMYQNEEPIKKTEIEALIEQKINEALQKQKAVA